MQKKSNAYWYKGEKMVNFKLLNNAGNGRYGATQIDGKEVGNVTEVLKSKMLFRYDRQNSYSKRLEEKLKEFYKVNHALALCNGSCGLKCALVAMGIGKNDEVLVTPYTFIATVNAIVAMGAIPVFVDINDDFSINIDDARKKLSQKTKALITVHIQGDATNLQEESDFCKKNGIAYLEDSAQSFGSSVNGVLVGSLADVGCFSLQSNKLVTCGEGGFIVTNDKGLYVKARNYHDQGGNRKDELSFADWDNLNALFGENCKITELQSSVALAQMEKADNFLVRLRENRKYIKDNFKNNNFSIRLCVDFEGGNGVSIPFIASNEEERNRIVELLKSKKIATTTLYGKLIYQYGLYKNAEKNKYWKANSANCENADSIKGKVFWVYNSLEYGKEEIDYILDILNGIRI